MKVIKLVSILILLTLFLLGCSSGEELVRTDIDNEKKESQVNLKNNYGYDDTIENEDLEEFDKEEIEIVIEDIKDYFPFLPNTLMVYKGQGTEFSDLLTFVEYTDGNKAQIKFSNPGLTGVRIFDNSNGEIFGTDIQEMNHIENILDNKFNSGDIYLKAPLTLGSTWTTKDGYIREISGIDVDFKTHYGDFKAIEITTQISEDKLYLEYYAKDIGFIGSIYKDGEFDVKTILSNIVKGPIEFTSNFYYPIFDSFDVFYIEDSIFFNTNDSMKEIIEERLKNPPRKNLISILNEETTINSIKVERINDLVRVDFSADLVRDIGGSGIESAKLQSIVNTFGDIYNVNNVSITLDGKNYRSGHFYMEIDEYFQVDRNNIYQYVE